MSGFSSNRRVLRPGRAAGAAGLQALVRLQWALGKLRLRDRAASSDCQVRPWRGARHLNQVVIGERRYGLAYSSGTPLLDVTARPLSSATDDETQILSVPVQLRRSGREIRMLIDRPDPFAAAKPDARLIKLLVRARLFNAALVSSADISFAARAKREPVIFHPRRFTTDSPLEGDGFELPVPVRQAKLARSCR